MVAELVETSRLWGRDRRAHRAGVGRAARRAPASSAPTASRAGTRKRGAVVATERVTLYGLPIVAGRTVAYGRIDPALVARAVHPPRAGRGRLGDAPRVRRRQRAAASRRSRRSRSARAGATSSSPTRSLLRLLRRARSRPTSSPARTSTAGGATRAARDPDLLTYPRELLVAARRADALDPRARPDAWRQGDLDAARSATASSPGAEHDGVTVHVPLDGCCAQLRADGFDWLVPALRGSSSSPR